jgi:hypothetical protein
VLLDDGLADVGVLTDLCALGVPIVAAATSIAAIILGTDVVVPFDSTEDGALASAVEHAVTDRTLRAAQATAAGACATTHAWDTHISAIDDIVRPAL